MITTSQFQERLIEYLDGDLPEAERREVEEYLRVHPEAARLEGDLARLSEAGRSIRESSYPADLLLEANRALAARWAARSDEAASSRAAVPAFSGNGSPEMSGSSPAPHRRRWRPRALAAALAAAAILLAGAVSQRAAIAEVASSLVHRISISVTSDSDGRSFEVTIDGEPVEVRETIETGDGGVIMVIHGDDNGMIDHDLNGMIDHDLLEDLILTIDGEPVELPLPAGKTGDSSPGVPARSWGDVKEAVDPAIEASP